VIGLVTLGFGLLLVWPLCGVWAAMAAKRANERAGPPAVYRTV
jgi:hypothetical protein